MEVKNFTEKQINHLEPYKLPNEVTAIESQLYLYKYRNQLKLLKRFYRADDSLYLGNKLLTIALLQHYKDQINIPQLVLPGQLISINKQISGFIMPFIPNNTNLFVLLQSKEIDVKTKIKLLKSCGKIIQAVHYSDVENFYLADIHESNFIYKHDNNMVYAVDLDGCRIGNNQIFSTKYGSFNEKFFDLPNKYPINGGGEPIINTNTEWYCYTMMILNTIGQGKVSRLLLNDFYDYLYFLKAFGVGEDLIDYFYNLYTNKENLPPMELLEQIPNNIEMLNIRYFANQKKLTYM